MMTFVVSNFFLTYCFFVQNYEVSFGIKACVLCIRIQQTNNSLESSQASLSMAWAGLISCTGLRYSWPFPIHQFRQLFRNNLLEAN